MTDSSLQSLYPVNQIGADGFSWWIGQIEKDSRKDPKGSGRCKVRIVGLHPQSCDSVGDMDLPWATSVMPVTNPHSNGGPFSASSQLKSGHWVVGFFLDQDKQQPVIIGSIGRVANSTKNSLVSKETAEEGCNSFTTYLDAQKQIADQPAVKEGGTTVEVNAVTAGTVQDGVERKDNDGNVITTSFTNLQAAKYSDNSATNSAGINFCVEKADKCGKDQNLSGTFTNIFAEMLAETQRNDGKLGNYLVGKLSGEMMDVVSIGRKYVDKAVLVVKTFIANIKGFVVKQIREAVKKLTDALLRPTDDGNVLTPVTKFLNDALGKVGCQMADLGDRLAAWLQEMIFGYLFNLYKQTACQVDKFIGGLLNKIQSLMNELLESILGPLQQLLGAIAKPLNMIGDAINKVLSLLGIQCTGPKQKCSKTTKVCTDCGAEKQEDFLDRLLKDLGDNDSQDWNQYTCDDNNKGLQIKPTVPSFVGGIQAVDKIIFYNVDDIRVTEGEKAVFTVTRSGYTDIVSSVTYRTRSGSAKGGEDYQDKTGILGFVAGEKSKTVEVRTFADSIDEGVEDFFFRIFVDSPGRPIAATKFKKNISRCQIVEGTVSQGVPSIPNPVTGNVTGSNPTNSSSNPTADPFTGNVSTPPVGEEEETTIPTYSVSADKLTVKEGGFVTYTITTKNVPSGTALDYQLFGASITPSDIVSNNLGGIFTIENSTATVIVGIKEDSLTEDEEDLTFAIPGTGASVTVLIQSDITSLNDEEISEIEDQSTDDLTIPVTSVPVTGDVITDTGGGIISIPIVNPGSRYTEPPVVFITGEGYGASGEVLLDTNGFAREIRIIDPGFGYKINIPQDAKKECIIDSFTMVRPGREYTTEPTVFVNGIPGIADAVINDKGQIISVRVKDRTSTFSSYPEVKILGGGGYGAKFIPSFACLDPTARVEIGSAKVGIGSYIDCP